MQSSVWISYDGGQIRMFLTVNRNKKVGTAFCRSSCTFRPQNWSCTVLSAKQCVHCIVCSVVVFHRSLLTKTLYGSTWIRCTTKTDPIVKNVKSFRARRAQGSVISLSVAFSQTQAYAARPRIRG